MTRSPRKNVRRPPHESFESRKKRGFVTDNSKRMTPEILFDPSPPDLELVNGEIQIFCAPLDQHWHGWSNLPDSCRKRNANAPGGLF